MSRKPYNSGNFREVGYQLIDYIAGYDEKNVEKDIRLCTDVELIEIIDWTKIHLCIRCGKIGNKTCTHYELMLNISLGLLFERYPKIGIKGYFKNKLEKKIDRKVIELFDSPNIYNYLSKKLFRIKDVDIICDILTKSTENLTEQVNKVDSFGETFLFNLFHTILSINQKKMESLVNGLLFHYYNFDIVDIYSNTLIDHLIFSKGDAIIITKLLITNEFDITKNCRWIYLLINQSSELYLHIGHIFNSILKRDDYLSFLYNIILRYHYPTSVDDIIIICNLLSVGSNRQKLQEMYKYVLDKNLNLDKKLSKYLALICS